MRNKIVLCLFMLMAFINMPVYANGFDSVKKGERSALDLELSHFLTEASEIFLTSSYDKGQFRINNDVAAQYFASEILEMMISDIQKTQVWREASDFYQNDKDVRGISLHDKGPQRWTSTHMFRCGPRLEREISENRFLLRAVFPQGFARTQTKVPDAQYVLAEVERNQQAGAKQPFIVTRWVAYPLVMNAKTTGGECPSIKSELGQRIHEARENALDFYNNKTGSCFVFNHFNSGE